MKRVVALTIRLNNEHSREAWPDRGKENAYPHQVDARRGQKGGPAVRKVVQDRHHISGRCRVRTVAVPGRQ